MEPERTMTVKQIAEAVGKDPATVSRWVSVVSAKVQEVYCKVQEAKATSKPARYTLEEACQIIEGGMGKAAADVYRTNAVNAALSLQPTRKAKLPSGAQLREMRLGMPQSEFQKRIDFLIGYSSHQPRVFAREAPELATPEQGELAFEEIRRKLKIEGARV